MARRTLRLLFVTVVAVVVTAAAHVIAIVSVPTSTASVDRCAIVLGAAVADGVPSPVYAGRLEHAVALHDAGSVDVIFFTGGVGEGDVISEAAAGRAFAVEHGVAVEHTAVEEASTTTADNLRFIAPVVAAAGRQRCFLVSDPLHLRRAVALATDAGLDVVPSPTPTTRVRSFVPRATMALREAWFLFRHHIGV